MQRGIEERVDGLVLGRRAVEADREALLLIGLLEHDEVEQREQVLLEEQVRGVDHELALGLLHEGGPHARSRGDWYISQTKVSSSDSKSTLVMRPLLSRTLTLNAGSS